MKKKLNKGIDWLEAPDVFLIGMMMGIAVMGASIFIATGMLFFGAAFFVIVLMIASLFLWPKWSGLYE